MSSYSNSNPDSWDYPASFEGSRRSVRGVGRLSIPICGLCGSPDVRRVQTMDVAGTGVYCLSDRCVDCGGERIDGETEWH